MNILVQYYLQKEAGLPALAAQNIGKRLTQLGHLLIKPKVFVPAMLGGGAIGTYELGNLEKQRNQIEQEADQLRLMLEANPELLNAGLMPDEQQ